MKKYILFSLVFLISFFLITGAGAEKKVTVISKGQTKGTFIPEAGGYQTIIELVKFKFYK